MVLTDGTYYLRLCWACIGSPYFLPTPKCFDFALNKSKKVLSSRTQETSCCNCLYAKTRHRGQGRKGCRPFQPENRECRNSRASHFGKPDPSQGVTIGIQEDDINIMIKARTTAWLEIMAWLEITILSTFRGEMSNCFFLLQPKASLVSSSLR